MILDDALAAVVLAGGRGRRIGGGKHTQRLAGRPLIEHVLDRLKPQVSRLLVNGPAGDEALERPGLPVIADAVPGRRGPLAGVLGTMDWLATEAPECRWLLSVPVDVPFLPGDLVAKLAAALNDGEAEIACAGSAGIVHPVIALTPLRLRADLSRMVRNEDGRKVRDWLGCRRTRVVLWPADELDPFFNVNLPDDLAAAEAHLAQVGSRDDRIGAA
ncbi:MAG: molybdenum cofactor guanylyltransferase MobA [Rhodospirillaceae bacterium]